jgi:hypothetical protein
MDWEIFLDIWLNPIEPQKKRKRKEALNITYMQQA